MRECLHILGIPSEVDNETVEESMVGLFIELGYSIDLDSIEACPWVSKNKKTATVNFTRHRKSGLKKMKNLGLPEQGQIFVSSSLCPYYKVIWLSSNKTTYFRKVFIF